MTLGLRPPSPACIPSIALDPLHRLASFTERSSHQPRGGQLPTIKRAAADRPSRLPAARDCSSVATTVARRTRTWPTSRGMEVAGHHACVAPGPHSRWSRGCSTRRGAARTARPPLTSAPAHRERAECSVSDVSGRGQLAGTGVRGADAVERDSEGCPHDCACLVAGRVRARKRHRCPCGSQRGSPGPSDHDSEGIRYASSLLPERSTFVALLPLRRGPRSIPLQRTKLQEFLEGVEAYAGRAGQRATADGHRLLPDALEEPAVETSSCRGHGSEWDETSSCRVLRRPQGHEVHGMTRSEWETGDASLELGGVPIRSPTPCPIRQVADTIGQGRAGRDRPSADRPWQEVEGAPAERDTTADQPPAHERERTPALAPVRRSRGLRRFITQGVAGYGTCRAAAGRWRARRTRSILRPCAGCATTFAAIPSSRARGPAVRGGPRDRPALQHVLGRHLAGVGRGGRATGAPARGPEQVSDSGWTYHRSFTSRPRRRRRGSGTSAAAAVGATWSTMTWPQWPSGCRPGSDAAAPKGPMRVPRLVARLFAGNYSIVMMTEIRGASNAKAKRRLHDVWPGASSWQLGSAAA